MKRIEDLFLVLTEATARLRILMKENEDYAKGYRMVREVRNALEEGSPQELTKKELHAKLTTALRLMRPSVALTEILPKRFKSEDMAEDIREMREAAKKKNHDELVKIKIPGGL